MFCKLVYKSVCKTFFVPYVTIFNSMLRCPECKCFINLWRCFFIIDKSYLCKPDTCFNTYYLLSQFFSFLYTSFSVFCHSQLQTLNFCYHSHSRCVRYRFFICSYMHSDRYQSTILFPHNAAINIPIDRYGPIASICSALLTFILIR